ncbi:MAG TPA: response regulator [Chthoniobacterales bacterium]
MADHATLRGKIILLLESNDDARDFITQFLTRQGATVLARSTAKEALAAIPPHSPSVVLLGIGLSDLDRLKLLRDIRALGSKNGWAIPVIAIAGFSRSVGRTTAIAAGFRRQLEKPFLPAELLEAINEVLS